MDARLSETVQELAPRIEAALEAHFPKPIAGADQLYACMRYATFSGGRRMRPMLCLMGSQSCGADVQTALPLAAAVEYLHTASLIYDDLPAMDNADRRRGLPPAHAEFGEGTALLAGLNLVTHAFRLLEPWPRLAQRAARCVGEMSAGQAIDLHGGARDVSHYLKTTALFRLAVVAGAQGAGEATIAGLEAFGAHLGAAYQLMDDADDEFAEGLCERAQLELSAAHAALTAVLPAARTLAAYADFLLAPVPSSNRE